MIRKRQIIFGITLVAVLAILYVILADKKSPVQKIKLQEEQNMEKLHAAVSQLLALAKDKHTSSEELKNAFLHCRNLYKESEFYIEYFFPSTSRQINGPPITEIELGENLEEPPGGFQVIEPYIFEKPSPNEKLELVNEIRKLSVSLKKMLIYHKEYELTEEQLLDAIRLEIFRIAALGLSGFDTPLSSTSIAESALALKGIKSSLVFFDHSDEAVSKAARAIAFIDANNDFVGFDRLTFMVNYLQPLGGEVNQLRKRLNLPVVASGSALYNTTYGLFQQDAFDINQFATNYTEYQSAEKITLGRKIFFDPLLSSEANMSCASCHQPDKAFSDGLPKAVGVGGKTLLRNTPTLTYAALQRGFFYDLKASTLEDQALDVVHHKDEMHGSLEKSAKEMGELSEYLKLFREAYKDDKPVDSWRIQHALASYIKSLAPFNSRFDSYMRGNKTMLSSTEKNGFNLFMGKAKCGSCHFLPLFNGTPAPLFNKTEVEVLGVPIKADTVNAEVDGDKGKYGINPYSQYLHAFKTPTLRNIGQTAPYMHNGVYQTLEEVLDFYNRGGGAGIGIDLENQTLSTDPLKLSKKEISDIIAFLNALSDEVYVKY